MPDHSGATSSRDFAVQTGEHGQHPFVHYDTQRDPNAAGAPLTSIQTYAQDQIRDYPAFNAQDPRQGQFPPYGFNSGAWDWNGSIESPAFANHYEPQGELMQELRSLDVSMNEPNVAHLSSTVEPAYRLSHQAQGAVPGIQNPLSPPPKPLQHSAVQAGMKRKAESESSSAASQSANVTAENPTKRPNQSRTSSGASPAVATPNAANTQTAVASATSEHASRSTSQANNEGHRRQEQGKGTGPQGKVIDVSKPRRVIESSGGPNMLPAGKVFPIQIGSELFRLSGASISSDAPSYFSHFFSEQLQNNGGRAGDVRTLYIDRDPDTFRDIALHLQGYHITPRSGEHFVKLFADSQFYSLPRLTKQLFNTDIFVSIGGTPFQIPRDLFSAPGNSPNYFSLGFAQFFSTPAEVFPGLDRSALLRPPSISPPTVPNKSGETFAELIRMLQGYTVDIRNDTHRAQLLRDARYFHFRGLEQHLIPCEVSYNLKRQQSEILLRLEDIRQSGVSFAPDDDDAQSSPSSLVPQDGYVSYARPYIDDQSQPSALILELSSPESTTLSLAPSPDHASSLSFRATFHNSALARITSLFSVIAAKMGLPATQPLGLMYLHSGSGVAAQPVNPENSGVSERRVRVRLDSDCVLEVDGRAAEVAADEEGRLGIRRVGGGGSWVCGNGEREVEWVVQRAHWRLRVESVASEGEGRRMQVVLCGVRIEAYTVERSRNLARGFLGSA
ncbi:hypothetical protein P153DRAFT_352119 [Dothidotthia symphoricarpi CBS 119687]|uniref:BTB/POZ domain-containing protein n=1 Tax=Dothidotthia symphoricarpi CBS 119687 TaxID=1392245 RepID=A0A6A5ZXF9_9PLEO|nr:uncharacterized protein P153DRAFT_352119 [Dothidotthia symphoricarpi CBS 119687]KAF2123457.1 hypothetical protein P153DRAFT_352119 [Dothidotthia symphoricarpi CBS 119687]